jgi:hypothetical protein
MEHKLHTGSSDAGPQDAKAKRPRAETLRCDICRRRLGSSIFFLEETGDVPEPRRSWVLCHDCSDAVHEQMSRAPIQSPMRLRVAVGLVSTERTPEARRARFGQLTDQQWAKLFFWLFFITMLVHLAVLVFIASIIK